MWFLSRLFLSALAHMSLVLPPPRNAVDKADLRWAGGKFYPYEATCAHPEEHPDPHGDHPTGCWANGTDGWGCNCANGTSACEVAQSCFWFSQGCTIGCKTCDGGASNPNTKDRCGSGMQATLNDPKLRTYNRAAPAGSDADIYKHNPWRAPGFAPIYDACGMASGGPPWVPGGVGGEAKYFNTTWAKAGELGSKVLQPAPSGIVWRAGGVATAKWSIRANHGGGYSYRLCARSETLDESCFQRTPLRFASRVHRLEFVDGAYEDVNATFVSEGTKPRGSMWAMNPLPYSNKDSPPEFEPPCEETVDRLKSDTGRCSGRDPYNTTISDQLEVPAGLRPGSYVLGIRWDCEKSAQVWSNCADIEVV
jgi:hypothetical protein